jgi:nanoRNase/pAp phosphatase (c-di-AMP/oligoRNAs hydrolase)
MALTIYEQIIEYIKESKKIIIAIEKKVSADSLGSALALSKILNYYNKPYQITMEGNVDNYKFLTNNLEIAPNLKQARRLVVSLDITEQGIEKFYYTTDEAKQKLEIFVVPKNGFFNPDDVRVGQGGFEYNLIITMNASDFFALGSIYQENTAFFHETPIINIDHKASNEKFGEINLVESTKSSSAEIIFDLMESHFTDLIDKSASTALLAGILEKTQSFRVPTLTPQTLQKASKLMAYEADRELAVRELFFNKSLPMVKLWGRVLARLKENKTKNLYWSLINTEDYGRAQADPGLIEKVFEEVLNYLPREATIILFSEFNNSIYIIGHSGDPQINLEQTLANYKLTKFEFGVKTRVWDKDLIVVEKEVIELFN